MPALGGRQEIDYSYRDFTDEIGRFKVFAGEITAASIAGFLTQMGALTAATEALVLGVRAKESWGEVTIVSNDLPASKAAQRENKLLVQYRGTTTEAPYTLTIPTIDLTKLNFVVGAKDVVLFEGDGASDEVVAWVTAFETIGRTPDSDTETVEVTGMRFVGRNS